jgi:energy-converting hydrogenase Eha subunit E
MGLLRGTKLALAGAFGAALAWWFDVGAALRRYDAIETALERPALRGLVAEHAALLGWAAGAFVAVVAVDLLGTIGARNRDETVSSTLGVGKGVAAVGVGLLALAYDDALFAAFARRVPDAAEFVRTSLGGEAAFCFAVGLWVGAVVADAARL